MEERLPRLPLFRMMAGNATLLSLVYLGFGLGLELLRRFLGARAPALMVWIERVWEGLDQLPARILQLLGLLQPLREAYLSGRISELGLRVCFGLTAVGLIFAMAVVVGLVMWVVRQVFYRSA